MNTVEPAYNGGGKSPILFRYEEVSVINLVCPIQITPVKSANSFRYREVSVIIRSVISRFYCSNKYILPAVHEILLYPS